MQKKQLGFLLMSVSAVGLAVGTIMMKILPAEAGLTPGQVAVWRFLIASPLMWLFTLARKRGKALRPESPGKLLGLGVVYSMASLLALLALSRLPSSIYVIILFFYPSIIVAAHLINRKPVPRLWWLGLPLTLIGLVLTVAPFGQPVALDALGIFFAVLNGITISIYMLLSERVFAQVRDRQLGSTWMMTGAMGVGLALAFVFGFKMPGFSPGLGLFSDPGCFRYACPHTFDEYRHSDDWLRSQLGHLDLAACCGGVDLDPCFCMRS